MDWLDRQLEAVSLDALLKYGLVGMNCITILVLWLYRLWHPRKHPEAKPHVLLVTAHPDDEAMFFQPTINELEEQYVVHLLCLSGNEDRRKELEQSCRNLGIHQFHCLDSDRLVDGMKQKWDQELIRSEFMDYARKNSIKAAFTFDGYGISGHPNHIAVSQALDALAVKEKSDASVKLYQLESVNLLRKYSGFLDMLCSMLGDFLFTKLNPWSAYQAMSVHKSQFVWYRRLFVLFSRYSYVNTYAGFKYIPL